MLNIVREEEVILRLCEEDEIPVTTVVFVEHYAQYTACHLHTMYTSSMYIFQVVGTVQFPLRCTCTHPAYM